MSVICSSLRPSTLDEDDQELLVISKQATLGMT